MTQRITNDFVAAFVKNVREGLPQIEEFDYPQAEAELTKRAYGMLPAEVLKLHKKYPGLVAIEYRSAKYDRHDGSGRLRSFTYYVPAMLGDALPEIDDVIARLEEYHRKRQERDDLLDQLSHQARRFNTVKRLAEALPDLAKYIPEEAKVYALTTGDIAAKLKQEGLK